ncbi:MAG: type II toxin-antitoxin system VapC family toxin [Dehalococcoidia bacterium]
MLNLDTHILIDALDEKLSRAEQRVLYEEEWCISAIVLWEIELLARGGRLKVDLRSPELLELLDDIVVIPIDVNVARSIRKLDFRSDPADELIAATSIHMDVSLVTRDERILKSRVVPLVRF